MAVKHTCPMCGSEMFHDKGNHITFCAECDHVGWPHDVPVTPPQRPEEKSSGQTGEAVTSSNKKEK